MSDLYVECVGPAGAGASLVFMHGPGVDHTYFRPFVDPLGERFQLIFFDARDSGRSSRLGTAATLDQLAEDLEAIVTTHARGTPIVVAHSFAPWVALKALARGGSAIKGLILVAPGLTPSVGEALRNFVNRHGTVAQQTAIAAAFAGQISTDADLERAWRALLPLYFAHYSESLGGQVLDRIRFSAHAFKSFMANAFGRLDWQAALAAANVPVLVVAGARDWVETDQGGGSRAVAAARRGASFALFPDSGHLPFVEEPDRFVATVQQWMLKEFPRSAGRSQDPPRAV